MGAGNLRIFRCVALALAVAGFGCAKSFEATPSSLGEPLLDGIGKHFPSARKWFGMVSDLEFTTLSDGDLEPRFESLSSALVLQQDGAGQRLVPRLPALATGAHTISVDGALGVWVRTYEPAVAAVPAEVAHGVVVYRGALLGSDLLYKLTPTHVDEYLYLSKPPERLSRRVRVELGPQVSELREASGRNTPSIDPKFANTMSANYWTSTPVAPGTSQNWTVKFDYGEVVTTRTGAMLPVRCVRGEGSGTFASGRLRQAALLTPSGVTVLDEDSGLEWQRKDDGVRRTWRNSLASCASLDLDGKHDWNLATVTELRGLVEYAGAANGGATIDAAFETPRAEIYWSSTPNDGIPTLSWGVGFNLGVVDGYLVSSEAFARCVRHLPAAKHKPASGCGCRALGTQASARSLVAATLLLAGLMLRLRRRRRQR